MGEKDSNRFYGYKHWTLEEVQRCFYVGKGQKDRPFHRKSRNHKWKAIAKRLGCRVEVCIGPILHEKVLLWETFNIIEENTYTNNFHYNDDFDIGCNFSYGGIGPIGWTVTEETRKKMSIAATGKKQSEEHKRNNKASNSIAQKKAWEKPGRKERQSEAVSGIKSGRHHSVNCYTKSFKYIATYPCITDAEKQTNACHSHIRQVCLGNRPYAKGYIWRYVEDCDPNTHVPHNGHFIHEHHVVHCSICHKTGHRRTNCPNKS